MVTFLSDAFRRRPITGPPSWSLSFGAAAAQGQPWDVEEVSLAAVLGRALRAVALRPFGEMFAADRPCSCCSSLLGAGEEYSSSQGVLGCSSAVLGASPACL